jgi:hypothetical protein
MAQIDFSGTVQLANSGSPVTQSYAHTGGALLALCMFGAGAGKRTVSSITFNGAAPDEVLVSSANGSNAELTLHAVVWHNVSAVTANFVMTLSGGGVYGSCRLFSVTGHDTADSVQAFDDFFAGTTGTSYSNSLPSLAASTLVIDMVGVVGNRTSTIAEDGGQTEVGTPHFGGAFLTTAASYEVGTGVFALGWTWTTAENRNQILVAFNNSAGGSPPSVTDVDSDEAFASNATGVTITGTDLGATTGDRTVELVQGATEVAQTQTAGGATSGAFTVVGWGAGGLLSYGVSTDLKVTTSEGDDSLAVTVNPPSGFAYLDIVTPDTEADYRIEGDPVDIEADDQIEYATTTNSGSTVEIDDAGVVTETGGDHTADALSFTPVTGAELGAVTASGTETITGVDATFAFRIQDGTGWGTPGTVTIAYTPAITIVGGEYRINGGSWTSAPGTVAEGDDVEVRGAASDFYDTETFVTVSIDSDEYQFSITTLAADTTPEAFSFVDQTDVELSIVCTSAAITVDGIEAPAVITISGGTYSINGGDFTSDAGVVSDGDLVQARVTSSGSYATGVTATVTIGGVSDGFTATTRAQVAPTITTTTLAGGNVASAYSRVIAATGDGPFTWAVTVGTLPDGLALDAGTGVISGTPTTIEDQTFTVEATNDAGSDDQELSISIGAERQGGGQFTIIRRRRR